MKNTHKATTKYVLHLWHECEPFVTHTIITTIFIAISGIFDYVCSRFFEPTYRVTHRIEQFSLVVTFIIFTFGMLKQLLERILSSELKKVRSELERKYEENINLQGENASLKSEIDRARMLDSAKSTGKISEIQSEVEAQTVKAGSNRGRTN